MTVAPEFFAKAAVLSVLQLSKTYISDFGSAALKDRTTSATVSSSLKQGMQTATVSEANFESSLEAMR
jgi:hypothetical protein